jgi:hypothetical protein
MLKKKPRKKTKKQENENEWKRKEGFKIGSLMG